MKPAFTRLSAIGATMVAVAVLASAPANSVPWSCDGITVSIEDKQGYENYQGEPFVAGFRVEAKGCSATEVVVGYATEEGGAKAGEDYESTAGELRWPAGVPASELHVEVQIENNTEREEDENFFVKLTAKDGNVHFARDRAQGTIHDGRAPDFHTPPLLSVSGTYCWLPPQGVCRPKFVLDEYFDRPVTIYYQTLDATARAGRDYGPVEEGVAIIERGQLTGYGSVRYGQAPADGRYFLVRVLAVPGGTIANATAPVTFGVRR